MPKNKNASERYLIIDSLLHSYQGKSYTQSELLLVVNERLMDQGLPAVSKRTLQDDIQTMIYGGLKAPIQLGWLDRERTYQYSDPHFTISNRNLNETEKQLMSQAMRTLSVFSGRPNFEWMDEIQKLLDKDVSNRKEREVISFEDNPDLKNRDLIARLFTFIVNKTPIEIKYQKFGTDPELRIMSPYYLKEYNNRWFLLAQEDAYSNFSTFAVDRIQSVDVTARISYRPTMTDFGEYFDDIIGVTRLKDESVQDVILWVSACRYPYIETKPLHLSQALIKNKKVLEEWQSQLSQLPEGHLVKLNVAFNRELCSLLLSFGSDIIVLSPERLQKDMMENMRQAVERYNGLK